MGKVILAAALLWGLVPAPPATAKNNAMEKRGIAVYYSPGVMERVAANRGLRKPAIADGMASVPDCSQIGKLAFASVNGGLVERYFIVDCSAPRDVARHLQMGLVLEVDYQSAVRNNFQSNGSAPATVYSIGGSYTPR